MKGGYYSILRGRPLSLTLAAVVLTTILLWAWEKNPFANTLLLAQERFSISSSGLPANTFTFYCFCVGLSDTIMMKCLYRKGKGKQKKMQGNYMQTLFCL